jgi:DNA-binding transcriptional ArsR family regulator
MTDQQDARLDEILRALADPTRRRLLALIEGQPGLSTAQLAQQTKGMTRWGVMKHLAVLDSAGLIQTMPEGRHTRHFHEPHALDPLRHWLASTRDRTRGSQILRL